MVEFLCPEFERSISLKNRKHGQNQFINNINSTLTYPKNLPVFTLHPEGNRHIFLVTSIQGRGKSGEKTWINLIC